LFTNGRKWEKASAAFAHQRGTAGDSEGGKEAAIADDPAGGADPLESGGEKRGSPLNSENDGSSALTPPDSLSAMVLKE